MAVTPIATPVIARRIHAASTARRTGDAGCSMTATTTSAETRKHASSSISIRYSTQCARIAVMALQRWRGRQQHVMTVGGPPQHPRVNQLVERGATVLGSEMPES